MPGVQTRVETLRHKVQRNSAEGGPWENTHLTFGHPLQNVDSAVQRRYVMDGITEMACFLRKNRDLSIENGLRLINCTLGPLLFFSGLVIIWPEKEFKKLTAAFVRCNKEAWQMSSNTSTALFTFRRI